MILDVNESFSWEKMHAADRENPVVQQWEALMWRFQEPLPQAKPDEKWLLMERIFTLHGKLLASFESSGPGYSPQQGWGRAQRNNKTALFRFMSVRGRAHV